VLLQGGRTSPRELAMELCKVLSATKINLKNRIFVTVYRNILYLSLVIVCGCLIKAETVGGELVTARCHHFEREFLYSRFVFLRQNHIIVKYKHNRIQKYIEPLRTFSLLFCTDTICSREIF